MNNVNKSPVVCPDPSDQEYADDWRESVVEPLQQIRDHLHRLAVIRRKRSAGWFESIVDGLLRAARETEGRLARGEE